MQTRTIASGTGAKQAPCNTTARSRPPLAVHAVRVLLFTWPAIALVFCGSAPAARSAPPQLAAQVFDDVNRLRQRLELPPLERAVALDSLAAEHSLEMAERGPPGHDGFEQRFKRADSRICVENIGIGYNQAPALVNGWMLSASHRRNLLEPRIRRVGVGVAGRYVTWFACD